MPIQVTHGYTARVLISDSSVRYEVRNVNDKIVLVGYAEDRDEAYEVMNEQMEIFARASGVKDATVRFIQSEGEA